VVDRHFCYAMAEAISSSVPTTAGSCSSARSTCSPPPGRRATGAACRTMSSLIGSGDPRPSVLGTATASTSTGSPAALEQVGRHRTPAIWSAPRAPVRRFPSGSAVPSVSPPWTRRRRRYQAPGWGDSPSRCSCLRRGGRWQSALTFCAESRNSSGRRTAGTCLRGGTAKRRDSVMGSHPSLGRGTPVGQGSRRSLSDDRTNYRGFRIRLSFL
jgi:hypothetical protein